MLGERISYQPFPRTSKLMLFQYRTPRGSGGEYLTIRKITGAFEEVAGRRAHTMDIRHLSRRACGRVEWRDIIILTLIGAGGNSRTAARR